MTVNDTNYNEMKFEENKDAYKVFEEMTIKKILKQQGTIVGNGKWII